MTRSPVAACLTAPTRKRGRPPLGDAKRRQAVKVWLSGAEFARLWAMRYCATGIEDAPMSAWLRELLFRGLENMGTRERGTLPSMERER